jgi:hypothetical protein
MQNESLFHPQASRFQFQMIQKKNLRINITIQLTSRPAVAAYHHASAWNLVFSQFPSWQAVLPVREVVTLRYPLKLLHQLLDLTLFLPYYPT